MSRKLGRHNIGVIRIVTLSVNDLDLQLHLLRNQGADEKRER
jgi:hypothetical protein